MKTLLCVCAIKTSPALQLPEISPVTSECKSLIDCIISVAGGSPVRAQGSQVQQQRGGAPSAALPRPRQPQIGPR